MSRREIKNEIVRVADLVVTRDTVTETDFIGCSIVGPAVLIPGDDTEIKNSFFPADADTMFWEIRPGREFVMGAVLFVDCIFDGCRFERVGFAGPPELKAQLPVQEVGK